MCGNVPSTEATSKDEVKNGWNMIEELWNYESEWTGAKLFDQDE